MHNRPHSDRASISGSPTCGFAVFVLLKPVEQPTTGSDGDRWPEAVAYDMAGEVTGGPAGAPESGTPE